MQTIWVFFLAFLFFSSPQVVIRMPGPGGGFPTVGAPVDSPGAGTYSSTQSVTLSDASAGFILYTVDGSTPACPATGTLYTGAFNISVTTTLKAIGCIDADGGSVLTSVYTISSGGTVAPYNTNTYQYTSASSSSGSFTISSGATDLGCVVYVDFAGTPSSAALTAATLGGSSVFANAVGPYEEGSFYVEMFTAINPATGSKTVEITGNADVAKLYVNLLCYQYVNQTTMVRSGSPNFNNGTSGTSATVVINSNSQDLTTSTILPNDGVTSTNQTAPTGCITNVGSYAAGCDYATTGAASVTHTWTITSGNWVVGGFSIQHD